MICDVCGKGPFAKVAIHKAVAHEKPRRHGTVRMYGRHKCRCAACKRAASEASQHARLKRVAARPDAQTCPDCGYVSTPQGLLRHRNTSHGLVHGTERGKRLGCRCDECAMAAANAIRRRDPRGTEACEDCGAQYLGDLKAHRRMKHGLDTTPAHGTESRYVVGCRCEPCRNAARKARARYRRKIRVMAGAKFACFICQTPFVSDMGRAIHESMAHRGDPGQASLPSEARKVRIAAGLTLREVGAYCGVTASAVCRWELGHSVPWGQPSRLYVALIEGLRAATPTETNLTPRFPLEIAK